MEHVIRTYIQACNDADANAIAACFGPEAVHYSPAGPKWVGAAIIGHHFTTMVQEQGHCWTVDQLVIDVDPCAATHDWTRFDRQHARILRSVDWFVFEPQTFRIQEVRPYTAVPIYPNMAR
jgi:SnoaL-like domain